MNEEETFKGFEKPEQNWTKFPHKITEIIAEIKSLAEVKVLLYILRHTWGFSEYDKPKLISIEEFENGRKKSNGTRMDSGTGLSTPSIIDGLRRAEEDGFIYVVTKGKDKGRIRKFYGLVMQDYQDLDEEQPPKGVVKELNPGSKGSLGPSKGALDRTKKDTIGETTSVSSPYVEDHSVAPAGRLCAPAGFLKNNNNGNSSSKVDFATDCAKKLYTAISSRNKLQRRPNYNEWKAAFRDLISKDEVPQEQVKRVLDWYCEHCFQEYVPVAISGTAFRKKFDDIVLAMGRDCGLGRNFETVTCSEAKLRNDELWEYNMELRRKEREVENERKKAAGERYEIDDPEEKYIWDSKRKMYVEIEDGNGNYWDEETGTYN